MDEYRDPLSDPALDRELQRALTVDSSPAFAARVRMRVANETIAGPSWSFRWQYIAAVCAVASALAIVMTAGSQPPAAPPTMRSRFADVPPASAPAVIAPSAPSASSHVASGSSRTTRSAVSGFSRTNDRPEVIVSVDEQRAFRQFIAAARQNRVPVMSFGAESGDSPLEVPAIEIAPITFDPLPQIAALEGERQ